MPSRVTQPITDSVPKVNNDVAVGSDLLFQRRWWRFERGVWIAFTILLALDLLGLFGRGPIAKAHVQTSDGAMNVRYERIERYGTPSILTIQFGLTAVRDDKVQFWVSDSLVNELGNQRVVPQPAQSMIGQGGILYMFPVVGSPDSVQFSLTPTSLGLHRLTIRPIGSQEVSMEIFVMP